MSSRVRTCLLVTSIVGTIALGFTTLTACGGRAEGDGKDGDAGDDSSENGDGDRDGDGDGSGSRDVIGDVESTLEIYSWWTGGHEAVALKSVVDIYNAKYPQVEVINPAANDSWTYRTLEDRMANDEPPDTFQAISGVDLLHYAKAGKMTSLDDLAHARGWDQAFPQAVLDILSWEGHLYAVPANIERENNLYYNTKIIAAARAANSGLTLPPRTLNDFYEACAYFQGEGIPPLTVPAAGWVLALTAFETLMPAINGGDYYMDFFLGNALPGTVESEMNELFTEFAKVLECSNVSADEEYWNRWDTHGDVLYRGEAAMYVMGDWLKGYLESGRDWEENDVPPLVAIEDFGVVPALGSEGHFVFNSAVFGLPKYAKHPNASKAFLDVLASSQTQEAFNLLKGSIPAHLGADIGMFDAMAQEEAKDFQAASVGTNKLLPGYASLTRYEYQVQVNPSLLVFAVGGTRARQLDPDNVPLEEESVEALDLDYIVSKMIASYPLLQN